MVGQDAELLFAKLSRRYTIDYSLPHAEGKQPFRVKSHRPPMPIVLLLVLLFLMQGTRIKCTIDRDNTKTDRHKQAIPTTLDKVKF